MDILLVLGNVTAGHYAPIKKFMVAQGMLPKVIKLDQKLRREDILRHEVYRKEFDMLESLVIPMLDDALSYKSVEPNWDLVDSCRDSVNRAVYDLREELFVSSLGGLSSSAVKAVAIKTYALDSIHYPRHHWDGTFLEWFSSLLNERTVPMYEFLGEARKDSILTNEYSRFQ